VEDNLSLPRFLTQLSLFGDTAPKSGVRDSISKYVLSRYLLREFTEWVCMVGHCSRGGKTSRDTLSSLLKFVGRAEEAKIY